MGSSHQYNRHIERQSLLLHKFVSPRGEEGLRDAVSDAGWLEELVAVEDGQP
jgi:hypothetical protein